jgi:hypothetical protein
LASSFCRPRQEDRPGEKRVCRAGADLRIGESHAAARRCIRMWMSAPKGAQEPVRLGSTRALSSWVAEMLGDGSRRGPGAHPPAMWPSCQGWRESLDYGRFSPTGGSAHLSSLHAGAVAGILHLHMEKLRGDGEEECVSEWEREGKRERGRETECVCVRGKEVEMGMERSWFALKPHAVNTVAFCKRGGALCRKRWMWGISGRDECG